MYLITWITTHLRPQRDGWLSWPCWLTDSGRLNRTVITHPASSLGQDGESLPAETSILTTMPVRLAGRIVTCTGSMLLFVHSL